MSRFNEIQFDLPPFKISTGNVEIPRKPGFSTAVAVKNMDPGK